MSKQTTMQERKCLDCFSVINIEVIATLNEIVCFEIFCILEKTLKRFQKKLK